jgi:PAS domain S-box-containing protein
MGSAICSVDGIIQGADLPFATLHGFQPDELMGSPLAGLIAPHCRGELPLHLQIAQRRGSHMFPSIHRTRTGGEFPVEVSLLVEAGTVRYGVQGAA